MRLWHKDLVPVLPRQQLLGQWRELCAIMRSIEAKGTPGHILANRTMDYPPEHLFSYAHEVFCEMCNRGYYPMFTKFLNTYERVYGVQKCGVFVSHDELFDGWHNDRYLTQCYHNLQEKHDCGGITDEEWELIDDRYGRVLLEHTLKKLDALAGKGRQ